MAHKKIVLFDGTSLDGWYSKRDGGPAKWTLEDGIMTVGRGDIVTRYEFGDAHIHLEFREPDMPDHHGQGKGNSCVNVHGCYEIQVLDSYGVEKPTEGDCAAIYGMHAPLTNACLPPLEWQSYDIYFRAPRCEGDKMVECARMTMLHNGIVVHNNILLPRATPGGVFEHPVARGPLLLQDHGCPVSYRNIYIEEL